MDYSVSVFLIYELDVELEESVELTEVELLDKVYRIL